MEPSTAKRMLLIAITLLMTANWINAKTLDGISINSIVNSTYPVQATGKMKVFLTVSSLAYLEEGEVVERRLEMNWYGGEVLSGDTVALYDRYPESSNLVPLVAIKASCCYNGFYRTNISYPRKKFTVDNLTNECLGYWIAYTSQSKIADISCLRSRPYWINENRNYIEGFTLREVALPGSHDAGSYAYFNPDDNDLFVRYTYAQEERIFEQLAYGIRHFDIRTGYYNDISPNYWINHNFMRTNNTLLEVLTDVASFVNKTKELVILEFHKFPHGIYNENDHRKLIKYISDILQGHMIPFRNTSRNVTIGEILNGEQRIIVAYDHPVAYTEHTLWPPLCQVWGDQQQVQELKEFLKGFYSKNASPAYLWSSMAELTPTFTYMIMHYHSSLREMADQVNRFITSWYRDQWWALPNIVATDYILGNNIVEVSIENNIRRKLSGFTPGKKIKQGLASFCSSS